MCSDWNIIDIVDEKHLKHAFEVANMDENEIKEQDDTSDTESDSGLDSDNKNSKIPEIIAEPNNLTNGVLTDLCNKGVLTDFTNNGGLNDVITENLESILEAIFKVSAFQKLDRG